MRWKTGSSPLELLIKDLYSLMFKRLSQYLKIDSSRKLIASMVSLRLVAVLASAVLVFCFPESAQAYTKAEKVAFQHTIIDRQTQLNPKLKKTPRRTTQYIIVHTSEGGLKSTLRAVSKGKKVNGRIRTRGGHAHYVIARDGRTYRIINKRYVADHAGLSMWNGQTDISKVSIGIELVGYHYTTITEKQYRSVGLLLSCGLGYIGIVLHKLWVQRLAHFFSKYFLKFTNQDMVIVSYSGKCSVPECKGDIFLSCEFKKGTGYIAKCSNYPDGHRFSIDPITLKGERIRS